MSKKKLAPVQTGRTFTIEVDIVDRDPAEERELVAELKGRGISIARRSSRRTPYACELTGRPNDLVEWLFANGYERVEFRDGFKGDAY